MKKIDRFILRETLSDGPAGTVYRAEEILPGDNRRVVALKVLPPLEGLLNGESPTEARFFGEVKVLAQLAVHPNIVTIYAMGMTEGYPWLAMEYAAATLEKKLADTPADPREVLRVIEQVGRGLAGMHAIKPPLIHQDLKPANVLVDALGNYKITDFSLATVTAKNRTQGLATVRYAAPEMLSAEFGRVTPATDLYALGHVAYELALGNKLCRQQFPAVYEGNSNKEPPPNKWMMWHASIGMKPAPVAALLKGFPATLSEVIAQLMAKTLSERYSSAADLLSDLSVLRQELAAPAQLSSAGLPAPARSSARSSAAPASTPPLPVPPAAISNEPTIPAVPSSATSAPATSSGSGADLARYWVRLRGKVTGPFDLSSLQRQIKQGHISRLHQISADQVVWKQATEIEGLYGTAAV